jgi:hypothetical protein
MFSNSNIAIKVKAAETMTMMATEFLASLWSAELKDAACARTRFKTPVGGGLYMRGT